MSEFLTQSALALRLEKKAGVSPETAKKFASVFFTIVRRGLRTSEKFSIYNFGTFKKSWIETSDGINPSTGEKIEIPAHWRIKFIPCSVVARRINRPYSHLKPRLIKTVRRQGEGLFAKASKLYTENAGGKTAENKTGLLAAAGKLEPTASVSAENGRKDRTVVDEEEFCSSIPVPVPVEPDELTVSDGSDNIFRSNTENGLDTDEDEYDETPGQKKSLKIIALAGLGALLFILIVSLVIKSCSSEKEKKRRTERFPSGAESRTAVELSVTEEQESSSDRLGKDDEIAAAELFESYLVPEGKSYYKIAEEKLGNRHLWPLIYSANKEMSVDPDYISARSTVRIPEIPSGEEGRAKIASAVLEAYNGYLLLAEKFPESKKNPARLNRAARVIVSGELLCPGFIDEYRSRILPEYAQTAKNIISSQYR